MKLYDTTFIINGTLDPDQREGIIAKYSAALEKFGGEMDRVVRWGLRDLSYEINKCKRGYYVFFYYYAKSGVISQFESELKLNENILRFITTLFDGKHPDYIKDETKKGSEPFVQKAPVRTPVAAENSATDTPVDDSTNDVKTDGDSTDEIVDTTDVDEPDVSEAETDTDTEAESSGVTAEPENSEKIEEDNDAQNDDAEEQN